VLGVGVLCGMVLHDRAGHRSVASTVRLDVGGHLGLRPRSKWVRSAKKQFGLQCLLGASKS
jgi:hypothetical protein